MRRVLICADDVTLESLLTIVVERMGHQIDIIHSGTNETQAAADLLLVDASTMHGIACARALRRLNAGMPVVSVGLETGDRDALGFAPTAVVPKPFGLDQLRGAVKHALDSPLA